MDLNTLNIQLCFGDIIRVGNHNQLAVVSDLVGAFLCLCVLRGCFHFTTLLVFRNIHRQLQDE
jgi:hypoxanthine-guanine phosphoribosyltransferase